MEVSRVRILEKFGVSSVVMPYFGYAHQSFLVLSSLCRGSRAMLNDFYRETVNWLYEWNMVISIDDSNIKMFYLPSDLFKYSFDLKNEVILQEFIEFLTIRGHHKGHYFYANYMDERLWIWGVYIRPDLIQRLVPHFDILKSTKVIDEKYSASSNFDCNICNMIDIFYVQNLDFIVDDTHYVLPQYVIDAAKLAESETCCKPFYKISYIFLSYKSYSQTMSILEDIGNLKMELDTLYWSASSIEELENLTVQL